MFTYATVFGIDSIQSVSQFTNQENHSAEFDKINLSATIYFICIQYIA